MPLFGGCQVVKKIPPPKPPSWVTVHCGKWRWASIVFCSVLEVTRASTAVAWICMDLIYLRPLVYFEIVLKR